MAERFIKALAFSFAAVFFVSYVGVEKAGAVFAAVVVHELGHIAALSLLGFRIKGIELEPAGLKINYAGSSGVSKEILSALAGPMAGMFFSAILLLIFKDYKLSADISVIYSLFNLLPIMPLDGGRALKSYLDFTLELDKAEKLGFTVSTVFSMLIAVAGLAMMMAGEGGGMFAAGLWLLLLQS